MEVRPGDLGAGVTFQCLLAEQGGCSFCLQSGPLELPRRVGSGYTVMQALTARSANPTALTSLGTERGGNMWFVKLVVWGTFLFIGGIFVATFFYMKGPQYQKDVAQKKAEAAAQARAAELAPTTEIVGANSDFIHASCQKTTRPSPTGGPPQITYSVVPYTNYTQDDFVWCSQKNEEALNAYNGVSNAQSEHSTDKVEQDIADESVATPTREANEVSEDAKTLSDDGDKPAAAQPAN